MQLFNKLNTVALEPHQQGGSGYNSISLLENKWSQWVKADNLLFHNAPIWFSVLDCLAPKWEIAGKNDGPCSEQAQLVTQNIPNFHNCSTTAKMYRTTEILLLPLRLSLVDSQAKCLRRLEIHWSLDSVNVWRRAVSIRELMFSWCTIYLQTALWFSREMLCWQAWHKSPCFMAWLILKTSFYWYH